MAHLALAFLRPWDPDAGSLRTPVPPAFVSFHSPLRPSLQFLDIMDGLLTADGALLHPDFEMDGTHMSPKYVRLLVRAFAPR